MSKKKDLQTKVMAAVMTTSMVANLCPMTVFAVQGAQVAKDGTYAKTAHVVNNPEDENDWNEYDVTVSLEVTDGKFSTINVTPNNDYIESESSSYFNKAFNKSKGFKTMLEGQAATEEVINNWDTVSGATCTSKAIKAAALEAIQEAEEAGSGSQTDTYIYGTVNLPYADFYYGELNQVESSDKMDLEAADKVAEMGYRDAGMYDAVSSATTTKSKRFGTTYYTESETGVEIQGLKDVAIAVPSTLYEEAQKAMEEGKACNNKLLEIIGSMTVSEAVPAEYKVLNGDGTLGAMVTETISDSAATVEISTDSRWGDYQFSVESEQLPTTDTLLGVVIETSDGKKYGMEHLENLWLQSGEIAFAVTENFVEPHGNTIDYKRHEDLQGKTVTKITYMIKGQADLVIDTNLLCKKLLGEGEGVVGEENVVYGDQASVKMTMTAPKGSNYKLSSISFGGNVLTEGTDYKYEGDTFTVYKTEKTGIGQYSFVYTDENYEDMKATVVLTAGYEEGSVTIKDNKLVLPEGLEVATYLNSISAISVNGKALRGSNLGTTIFNEDGSVNFDAEITSRGTTTVVFPEDGVEYQLEVTSIGYPSVSGTVTSPESTETTYVYGTVNLPYADFYYGELNQVESSDKMDLEAADKVAEMGYRDAGMYDAVSSATTTKSKRFGTTYYTESETGVEIQGLKDVAIAVPSTLYEEAQKAMEEGKACNNKLLEIIGSMTVSEAVPAEYKVLNGDGTLGAMVTETISDSAATVEISTDSRWGDYQFSVESEQLPTTDTLLGVVIETSDGKKYGMEHLENLWLQSGEIAFAVTENFVEPHGNTIDYKRHEDLQGKTVTKITYMIKGQADLVIDTNLLCKKLLGEGEGVVGEENVVYGDQASVKMTMTAPKGSNYKLSSISFGGNVLTEGTDYKYEGDTFTVYKTEKTGIGQYSFVYTDENYEDMKATVVLTAGYEEGSVTIKDNKLVLPEGLEVATYLNSISAISVNGKALRGSNLGTTIFNEDGSVNFDAEITSRGTTTVVFPEDGVEYQLEVTSIGYPSVSGTVISPTVGAIAVSYRTHVQNLGWQSYVTDGELSGTKGQSLRLEAIQIQLNNNELDGGISYRAYVQNLGWQSYVADGAMAGTKGQSLRLEAVQICLTGAVAEKYDVYYRTHVQDLGWLGWASNDGKAGTAGLSKRLEGIQIHLVEKGAAAPGTTDRTYVTNKTTPNPSVSYTTHVQNFGWQSEVKDGVMAGTKGQSLRLEAIKISVNGDGLQGGIEYSTHIQNLGWQSYVADGTMSGTKGRSLRLEAIKIRLTGELAQKYSVEYRTHVQNLGWQSWVKDDTMSGTKGQSLRLEAIEIRLVKK